MFFSTADLVFIILCMVLLFNMVACLQTFLSKKRVWDLLPDSVRLVVVLKFLEKKEKKKVCGQMAIRFYIKIEINERANWESMDFSLTRQQVLLRS